MSELNSTSNNRIYYIDFFRAFGILIMIMGHVGFGGIFDKWIHLFHMPMFFVVSEYFFKETSIGSLVSKRIRTVLVPYIFFGTIACRLYFFIEIRHIDLNVFKLLLWENTSSNGVPLAGAIWFLTAMFMSEMIYGVVICLIRNEFTRNIIVIIIALLGMSLATYLPFRLPFAIDVGMVGVGFLHIGALLKKNKNLLLNISLRWALGGCILFSILGFINSNVNLRTGKYGIWPLFWINSVCLTICLWNIFRYVYEWFEKKKNLDKLQDFILAIGKDSIVYLCLNQLIIHYIGGALGRAIPTSSSPFFLIALRQLLTLGGTVFVLKLARVLFTKTKLKWIIGRQ